MCTRVHIFVSVSVCVCVCVCGLHSWGWCGSSRVPRPVFLFPCPPSQRVLTQGGNGSLSSGFPGWAEVVS